MNAAIKASYDSVRNAAIATQAHVRMHFLDVYQLAWPRRAEMPSGIVEQDGLHWSCVTRLKATCREELHTHSQRPDEVAWAVMQAVLLLACGSRHDGSVIQ
mmetsp:Transcript_20470/g.50351  ORF Transcript_20470/g.50351 Transcript_20470/m.50351 type:complete len:101 (+) Transcript_20470:1051-1353(+)